MGKPKIALFALNCQHLPTIAHWSSLNQIDAIIRSHILSLLQIQASICYDFQMSPPHSTSSSRSWSAVLLLIVSFLSLIDLTLTNDNLWIQTTNSAGETIWLRDDRKPALYTQDFGDCLGSSLINVTRFDAAYYQDNMTVLFHLEGNTNVANESIMSMFSPPIDQQFHTDSSSVHWRFRVRRVSLRPHLQPLQCPDIQVRQPRMPGSAYH